MNKLFKITSLVLAGLLFVSLIFGAGVYAKGKGWLEFEDKQVSDADDNLERIMEILREVNTEKGLTKEQNSTLNQEVENLKTQLKNVPEDQTELVFELQAEIEELKEERPPGLAKKNQELKEQLEEANETIEQLEWDNMHLTDEKNIPIASENETERLFGIEVQKHEELKRQHQTMREENDFLNEELKRANEAVTDHNSKTEEAVTEAERYVNQE